MKRCPRLTLAFGVSLLLAGLPDGEAPAADAKIVRIAPASVETRTGYFFEHALDHVGSGPAIVAVDEDNVVWTALARSGKLARFANGRFTFYDIGTESRPVGIVPDRAANGRSGVIWIAAAFDDKLVRFDVRSGRKDVVDLSEDAAWPFMVALAPDGAVWFTQRAADRLGRLDPKTLTVTSIEVPDAGASPAGLAIDQTTGSLWFTESTGDRVRRFDPQSNTFTTFAMGGESSGMTSGPAGIAVGPQGDVWFAKLDGELGHIVPGSDTIEIVKVPPEARRPAGIALDRHGEVWALALDGNQVVNFNPKTRAFVLYPLPTGGIDAEPDAPPTARTSRPFGLAFDLAGDLWISEQYTGQLAVLDLTPPSLEILSPQGDTALADPLLTYRALDRVAGVSTVEVTLDGHPAQIVEGRLLLRNVAPGPHELRVAATDRAGHRAVALSAFDYRPRDETLTDIIANLPKSGAEAEAWRTAALETLEPGQVPKEAVREMKASFLALEDAFKGIDRSALAATFDYVAETGADSITVRLLDEPPFFSATSLNLHEGDQVTWKYDPPIKAHRISTALHQIVIAGSDQATPTLRSGESFTYRFEHAGTYKVGNTQHPKATATIKVLPR